MDKTTFEKQAMTFVSQRLTETHQNFAKPDYALDSYTAALKSVEATLAAVGRVAMLMPDQEAK